MYVAGLLLAAGEGRRMGLPKGLLRDRAGVPYLDRAVGALLEAGCRSVTVVLGAASEDVWEVLRRDGWAEDEDLAVVVNPRWAHGMGSSLRVGLAALEPTPAQAALVALVDLADVDRAVDARLVAQADSPHCLARATYGGIPGHPVLLGRAHWVGAADAAVGDQGARAYLAAHEHTLVECGDLATGRDLDEPADLG